MAHRPAGDLRNPHRDLTFLEHWTRIVVSAGDRPAAYPHTRIPAYEQGARTMWKKATIGGLVAVAVVAGTTGVVIAHAEGTNTPSAATATPTGTATTGATGTKTKGATKGAATAKAGDGKVAKDIIGKLKDFQHAEWVTKGDANTYVTHDAILGTVHSVSPTSITVSSADGTSMTFAVNDQTTVHQRKTKGATAGATTPTIADVKTGQTVLVGGAKSPDLTAKNVLVRAG